MTLKFLSPEWAEAVKAALNVDDAFKKAAAGKQAALQQVISTGDGDTRYWIRIADGTIDMGMGDLEAPDATITQNFDTAVGLAKNQVSAVTAFMTGKIKIDGNMGLLLGLQGAFAQLPMVMASLDVDYSPPA
ncbi:MAG: SCP2 sterol-binding domain-containing protein [Actinomycetota bacterium]|nr:SCP2 sterol-binding domain-containing protein [Actinomycetota bacterium]